MPVVVGEFDFGNGLSIVLNLAWEVLRSCLVRIIVSAGIASAIISITIVNVSVSSFLLVSLVAVVVALRALVVLLYDLDPLLLFNGGILVDDDLLF